jgi:two-component system sensor histidine kinase/response regulator
MAMTAHAMKGDREKCLTAGMNDYISKPIEVEQLTLTMAKWLRKETPSGPETPSTCHTIPAEPLVHTTENEPALAQDLPGIQVPTALKRLSNNQKLLIEIILDFCKDYAAVATEMRTLIAQDHKDQALRLAHTIKGVSGNIAALELQQASLELEKALRQESVPDLNPLLVKFDMALAEVLCAGQQVRQNVENQPSGAATGSFEPDRHLAALSDLLQNNDLASEETFATLKPVLLNRVPPEWIHELEERVRQFDFEKALPVLEKIKTHLAARQKDS